MTDREWARERLAAERADALVRLNGLERDLAGIIESSGAVAADDEHDPEGATIAFERQHVAALLGQARQQLAEIDAALRRVAAGGYGRCDKCGQPIGTDRLAARPAARTCIGCASRR
jgi:RNA polymerase-binding transcription factor DksA